MSSPVSQTPPSSAQERVRKSGSKGSRLQGSSSTTALKTDQVKDAIPTNAQEDSPKSPKLKTHSHAPSGIHVNKLNLANGERTFGQNSKD